MFEFITSVKGYYRSIKAGEKAMKSQNYRHAAACDDLAAKHGREIVRIVENLKSRAEVARRA